MPGFPPRHVGAVLRHRSDSDRCGLPGSSRLRTPHLDALWIPEVEVAADVLGGLAREPLEVPKGPDLAGSLAAATLRQAGVVRFSLRGRGGKEGQTIAFPPYSGCWYNLWRWSRIMDLNGQALARLWDQLIPAAGRQSFSALHQIESPRRYRECDSRCPGPFLGSAQDALHLTS